MSKRFLILLVDIPCIFIMIVVFAQCGEGFKKENADLKNKINLLEQTITQLQQEDTDLKSKIDDLQKQTTSKQSNKQQTKKREERDTETNASTRKVASWKGSGMKTTEPFTILRSPWVISWAHKVSEYGGVLQIFVYKSDGNLVSLAANTMQSGSDVSYVYDTGTFYLNINAANTNWAVDVHESK